MDHYNAIQKRYIEFLKLQPKKKDDELPFMKINCCACDDNVKFSRDFLEFLPFTPKV